jgi:hypothetical protein
MNFLDFHDASLRRWVPGHRGEFALGQFSHTCYYFVKAQIETDRPIKLALLKNLHMLQYLLIVFYGRGIAEDGRPEK